jgi:hypothetical protein
MPELDSGKTAAAAQEISDAPQAGHVLVQPYSVAAVRDAAFPSYRACFHDNETGASQSEAPQMDKVKVVAKTLKRAVKRHRRYDDAVLQRDFTHPERLEQLRLCLGCGLRCESAHADAFAG